MTDWQPGDLALCVQSHDDEDYQVDWNPSVGGCYTVAAYIPCCDGLELEEDPDKFNPLATWDAPRFIKITPGAEITGREVEKHIPVPHLFDAG